MIKSFFIVLSVSVAGCASNLSVEGDDRINSQSETITKSMEFGYQCKKEKKNWL